MPTDGIPTKGPKRAFFHDASSLAVISAVEFIDDGKVDGPEYHLSISRQHRTLGTCRCSSTEARWVLVQFGVEGALEDNHVPGGLVRNFWRPVCGSPGGPRVPVRRGRKCDPWGQGRFCLAGGVTVFDEMRRALGGCTFLPASWDKRFARALAMMPADKITERQRRNVIRLAWKYRRQMPDDLVPSRMP